MDINKIKYTVYLPIVVAVSVVLGFSMGYWGNPLSSNKPENTANNTQEESLESLFQQAHTKSKPQQLLDFIDKIYIDKIDTDTLTEEFLSKIVDKLDPHSLYIPKDEVQKANENLEGSFDGIGIMFNMVTDTLVVLEVIPGGPSSKVGLEMGDRIIKVDGTNIAGIKFDQNEVVKKLRGKGGSTVVLSVEREGISDLIDISVVRGKVAIKSMEAAFMITPKIGYIKLLRFARTTHSEVVNAIDSLNTLGMQTLIFDLKNNSGGYLDQAIYIANEFLPKGSLIVYTEGRGAMMGKQYSTGTGRFTNQKLYLLVDEFSASSSEIVAGAIQDNDRGILVGRRTYGKGLVQQQVPFTDGSVLNITVARYHTPSGRCIQKPYKLGNKDEYNKDILNRFDNQEFVNQDSISMIDTVKYHTKSNRVVYGGGGIMPDVFVPLDTTALNPFMRKAMSSLHIIKYVTKYSSKHSKELSKLKTVEEVKTFLKDNQDEIFNGYVDYMLANKVGVSRSEAIKNKKDLSVYLWAYIGQYTSVGENAFYSIIYPLDDIVTKAIELIDKENN